MKTAVLLDYKPTRYEGKGFLRKIHHLPESTIRFVYPMKAPGRSSGQCL